MNKNVKLFIGILLFFISAVCYSNNNICIEYTVRSNQPNSQSDGIEVYKLNLREGYSTYYKFNILESEKPKFVVKQDIDRVIKESDFLVKDYQTNSILFKSNSSFVKSKVVKDSMNLIHWKIDRSVSIKIMGYDCYKATGNFRGRNYTSYYTPKIPISDGPFKFSGLPGLILKISSDDNYSIFEATKIDLNDKSALSLYPIEFKNKSILFSEYAILVKKSCKQQLKEMYATIPQIDDNVQMKFEITFLEKTLQIEQN
jgi:GLPGLI family protein